MSNFYVLTLIAHIVLVSTLSYIIYKSTMYYLDDQELYSTLTEELLIKKMEIMFKTNSINYKLVRNDLNIKYLCIKSCLDNNIIIPFVIIINPSNNKKDTFDIRIDCPESSSVYLKITHEIIQILAQDSNITNYKYCPWI